MAARHFGTEAQTAIEANTNVTVNDFTAVQDGHDRLFAIQLGVFWRQLKSDAIATTTYRMQKKIVTATLRLSGRNASRSRVEVHPGLYRKDKMPV